MLLRRLFLTLSILILPLGGCFSAADRPVEVVALGDPASIFAASAQLPIAAQLLRAATVEGLVAFDEQGRVIPALADRWIVTDDGLSYIFRLRDGTWPDGSDITADAARETLLRAIRNQAGQPLGADLATISEVRAMAGRVIELRLSQQMPDMLQLLAQPELGLVMASRGAGPMTARRGTDPTLKAPGVLLRPIAPEDRGLPPVQNWPSRVRPLQLSALPAAAAITLFNRGDVDLVLGGGFADFPRLDAAGVSRGAIRLDPVAGLFGLTVVHADGFLSQPGNREAIAMAIDREGLIASFNISGWTATSRVVNPGLDGDNGTVTERWIGRTIEERRAQASARVGQWKAGGHRPAALRLALPAGPGGDILFARLASDLKAVGLETVRVALGADADLRLLDRTARYARPLWFLNELSCANPRALCSVSADSFDAAALAEPDPVKRADLLAQAEAQLTIANTYIPFGAPLRWSLVSGRTTGFAANRWGAHPLMPLAIVPR